MNILVVQESDWIIRNPHQQHHLMERMSLKGHKIRVIDYEIDWKTHDNNEIISKRMVFRNFNKIHNNAKIDVIRPSLVKIPILNYFSLAVSNWLEINRQIKEFKPDIIVGFGLINTYLASRAAKKHGIPFVYYLIDVLYTLIPEKIFQLMGKHVEKMIIKNSNLIIAINKKLIEVTKELGANTEKSKVINAGIDIEHFNPNVNGKSIRKKYGIQDEDTVLFFMGWIYHFAGLKEVAEELGKTKEKNSNIKVMIVGDGDAYNDLVKIKKDYNLENQLILTGKQPYNKIPQYIAASDICILPAYPDEEIMQNIVPIKLYEYMALSKPVIVSKLPGVVNEFGEGNGLIYVNHPHEVIETSLKINIKSQGKKSWRFVQHNDWEVITNNFENILNSLIKNDHLMNVSKIETLEVDIGKT